MKQLLMRAEIANSTLVLSCRRALATLDNTTAVNRRAMPSRTPHLSIAITAAFLRLLFRARFLKRHLRGRLLVDRALPPSYRCAASAERHAIPYLNLTPAVVFVGSTLV
jgi:hypothetical protein